MKKKKIIVVVVVIAALVLIVGKLIINKSAIDEKKHVKAGLATLVNVKEVLKKGQNSSLVLTGVTAPVQEVTLKAETGGQIVFINFNLGDYVTKGKVLVEIDDKLAKLNLDAAKLNLSKLEDEYNKTKNLYSGNATSETKVRDARIDYEKAKILVGQAEKQLSFTKITASQNGFIVSKPVDNGGFVGAGTPIVSIVDISHLKTMINVSETDIYKLKVGQKAKITSSVFQGVEYDGKISFISQQGDASHNYAVEIIMENRTSYQLKAGTFVNVDFNFPTEHPALLIPRTALIGSIKDAKVYVVENNNAFQRYITIGRDLSDNLEVTEGLKEGDKVVTTGQINLSDGAAVSIIKNKE